MVSAKIIPPRGGLHSQAPTAFAVAQARRPPLGWKSRKPAPAPPETVKNAPFGGVRKNRTSPPALAPCGFANSVSGSTCVEPRGSAAACPTAEPSRCLSVGEAEAIFENAMRFLPNEFGFAEEQVRLDLIRQRVQQKRFPWPRHPRHRHAPRHRRDGAKMREALPRRVHHPPAVGVFPQQPEGAVGRRGSDCRCRRGGSREGCRGARSRPARRRRNRVGG